MQDPYKTLGVAKNASQEEIKKAYRKLARELHPDVNPGDAKIEERFKKVSSAYHLLGDAERRKKFDNGEIDADGRETSPFARGGGHAGGGFGGGDPFGGFSGANAEDIFDEIFGKGRARSGGGGFGGFGGERKPRKVKGPNISYELSLDFAEAILGTTKRINLASGKSLEVRIPPGSENEQTLRLKGQGMAGINGGEAGDALIKLHVHPDKTFRREGNDLHCDLAISLSEAILGGSIEVPIVDGKVNMKLPANANSGTKLRLRGKGAPYDRGNKRGDQYVHLTVKLPEERDDELVQFIKDWSEKHPYKAR
ncbi:MULTISPECIES: J domain-containing protein [unclassified Thalassospira]|uniref:DnaJ C-terminal domain-containing protein n=1 Tax=unclassified Thalassospira TaxID=2648997 RepID=UPI0007A59B28|nr:MULTISPECIES: J domain-containing protein [unclassified Thalassospira]KZD00665.1 molecular chaperone DnaJ [Thalassospira sp. MCCC 1A02898]ONH87469.1 molecular chaperone DnaJ [Thalassospira sp. MCCC 1A02803]